MIDNLLYTTSKTGDMMFMSINTEFKLFLKSHHFDVENIMSHRELIALFK